jgi:hypothetical protein
MGVQGISPGGVQGVSPCLSLFSKEVGWLCIGGQVSRQWGYPIQEKVKARRGGGGADEGKGPLWSPSGGAIKLFSVPKMDHKRFCGQGFSD